MPPPRPALRRGPAPARSARRRCGRFDGVGEVRRLRAAPGHVPVSSTRRTTMYWAPTGSHRRRRSMARRPGHAEGHEEDVADLHGAAGRASQHAPQATRAEEVASWSNSHRAAAKRQTGFSRFGSTQRDEPAGPGDPDELGQEAGQRAGGTWWIDSHREGEVDRGVGVTELPAVVQVGSSTPGLAAPRLLQACPRRCRRRSSRPSRRARCGCRRPMPHPTSSARHRLGRAQARLVDLEEVVGLRADVEVVVLGQERAASRSIALE